MTSKPLCRTQNYAFGLVPMNQYSRNFYTLDFYFQALVVALNTVGMVSIGRTHEILSDLFCIPISTGTIHKMMTECAGKLTSIIDEIRTHIIASPIVHFDETGTRVDGKTRWYIKLPIATILISP